MPTKWRRPKTRLRPEPVSNALKTLLATGGDLLRAAEIAREDGSPVWELVSNNSRDHWGRAREAINAEQLRGDDDEE